MFYLVLLRNQTFIEEKSKRLQEQTKKGPNYQPEHNSTGMKYVSDQEVRGSHFPSHILLN